MAKYRETPCRYYIAFGACKKSRQASHNGYCQHCGKYEPRAKVRHVNQKKIKLDTIRKGEYKI